MLPSMEIERLWECETVPEGICEGGTAEPLKLWEIEPYFKCPVVGLCLTDKEQQQLLKKMGVQTKKLNAFEVHEILVACTDDENKLSIKVQSLLTRKYGKLVAEARELDEAEFLRQWKEAFASGQVEGFFWAAVTKPGMSNVGRRQVFGDVHMGMHATMEQLALMRRNANELKDGVAVMKKRAQEATAALRTVQAEKKALTLEMVQLRLQMEKAEKARQGMQQERETLSGGDRLARLEAENQRLRMGVQMAEERFAAREMQIEALNDRVAELAVALEEQRERNDLYVTESRRIIEGLTARSECDASCPAYDLCKKRVLLVGGIHRMERLYRELVEGRGGVFDFHDGYVRNGTRQLEDSFKRANVILCPVTCNSHAACVLVKNLGKKFNKPVHMLDNHSLSSVARAVGNN